MTGEAAQAEERAWVFRSRPHVPEVIRTTPKRKVAAVALVSILGVGAFCAGMLRTELFAIEDVNVVGTSRLKVEDITATAGLKVGRPLISVDQRHIENALEANPWIERATVTENWPHSVTVTVVERIALAQVATTDGKWAQVGPGGVVLAVSPAPVAKLAVVLDATARPQPGSALDPSTADVMTVAGALPDSLRARVTQIQQKDGTMRLGLDAGTIVILGDMADLNEKLMAAAAVLAHTDPKTLETLDVRSPHLPVATPKVKPAPPTSTSPSTTTKAGASTKSSTTTTPSKSTTTTRPRTTTTTR